MANIDYGYLKTKNGVQLMATVPYPVGTIYISEENINPGKLFGGTWELVDKEFKSITSTNGGFNPNLDNISTSKPLFYSKVGHTINFEFSFTNKKDLSDSTIQIGTLDFQELGITRLNNRSRAVGYTDGGNAVIMFELMHDTGVLQVVDIVGADIISQKSCFVYISMGIDAQYIMNEACGKFYWKRTA